MALKDHPWFSCLQGLDAEDEIKGNGVQAIDDSGVGRSQDIDSDSEGWKCTQCEEVNDEQMIVALCAADCPSDNNSMSTLLLHAVCTEQLQSLLFFVLSMLYSKPRQADLLKSSVKKALQVFENISTDA